MSPDENRERLRQFEALCRARGLALTVQRRRILELLLDRKDHPTADQIHQVVKKHLPGVSRTTVYRVLEMLVETGVITRASSPGAATRFDPVTRRHHHLVCLRCEKLIDLEGQEFRHRVEPPATPPHSFEIHDFSIHFHGICAACRNKLRPRRAAKAKTGASKAAKSGRRKSPPKGRVRRTKA